MARPRVRALTVLILAVLIAATTAVAPGAGATAGLGAA